VPYNSGVSVGYSITKRGPDRDLNPFGFSYFWCPSLPVLPMILAQTCSVH
jgi:hypothetical protein